MTGALLALLLLASPIDQCVKRCNEVCEGAVTECSMYCECIQERGQKAAKQCKKEADLVCKKVP